MTLAATSLGLGSHWASLVAPAYPSAMVKDLLGIPDGYCIYDMLSLGHPAIEPNLRLVRDRQAMTHYERFERFNLELRAQLSA
jgi:nitroreductase